MDWPAAVSIISGSIGGAAALIVIFNKLGSGVVRLGMGKFQTIEGCGMTNIKCVENQIKPICAKIESLKTQIGTLDRNRHADKYEAIAARKLMEEKLAGELKEYNEKLAKEIKETAKTVDTHYVEVKTFMGSINGKLDILLKNGDKK